MNGLKVGSLLLSLVSALAAATPSRADLFAAIPLDGEILRIDTATGNIVDTIEIPDWIATSQPTTIGLAYDGRQFLTLNVRRGGGDEFWHHDVVYGAWFQSGFPFAPDYPGDSSPDITGMGMFVDEYGLDTLVAVSHHNPAVPSHIMTFHAPLFPFLPEPIPAGLTIPLPPNFAALSADVDPATGELWVGGDEIGAVNTPKLLRVNMTTGDILQTLTPSGSASPIRGVGFDGGAMFVGVRNLPELANEIYEVDRMSGAVLRTITLPADKLIGGLAGGPVIPEPSAGVLTVMALALSSTALRRRAVTLQLLGAR